MNPLNRRNFIQQSALTGIGLSALSTATVRSTLAHPRPEKNAISLATWSIVQSFHAGIWKLEDVPRICREDFGIDGIEYVNQFFENPMEGYLKKLNSEAEKYGVRNVLIMVDDEGDMVAKDKTVRMQAAINHRKWVEIAAFLGCHAIRCNARGGGRNPEDDPEALDRAAEAFSALIEYAEEFQINILIENHGGLSSHPEWLPALMKKVNSPHFGILPDYGNYQPTEKIDLFETVRMAMPYAKGVSVKAGWQPDGTHPPYDLAKLLKISADSGYTGFWGIESGMRRSSQDPEQIKKDEWQAVLWTKAVIEKTITR